MVASLENPAMVARNDGGPAFAALGVGPSGDVYHETGMSLRDWFAGQALIGLCPADMSEEEYTVNPKLLARTAYAQADAILAERSKP
jgi:hypothetical protein